MFPTPKSDWPQLNAGAVEGLRKTTAELIELTAKKVILLREFQKCVEVMSVMGVMPTGKLRVHCNPHEPYGFRNSYQWRKVRIRMTCDNACMDTLLTNVPDSLWPTVWLDQRNRYDRVKARAVEKQKERQHERL
jgi:hypothetical protein